MSSDRIAGVSLQEAARAVAFYWGGAMVGRAIGTVLLARFDAGRLLALFAATAMAMCAYVLVVGGVSAGFIALAIGLLNSIMFPVIFTLTLERSTASDEATSGFLCTVIIGGAFIPLIVGSISDFFGLRAAFVVPAICYGLIFAFALAAAATVRVRTSEAKAIH